ncbi:hypothetical protein [Aureispira sp. CCB-QB1]|uniref:hypothetical protein n=1 Tax=Aureispira sp. CCB-QB1 TaxID=1313421 RepID=UPI000698611E|nr:hypothetical protein [Aureispira sp. CCB-QB1]
MSDFIFESANIFGTFSKNICCSLSDPLFTFKHLSFEAVAKVRRFSLSPKFLPFFYNLFSFFFLLKNTIHSFTAKSIFRIWHKILIRIDESITMSIFSRKVLFHPYVILFMISIIKESFRKNYINHEVAAEL